MSKLNNADVKFINGFGFRDIEEVDAEQKVWKGRPIAGGTKSEFVFFSRRYDKDNDMDKMLHEYYIEDESILGVKFLIVPREKILFTYNPPSSIIKVPLKISRRMGEIPGGL